MSLNQVCIIEGDYNLTTAPVNDDEKKSTLSSARQVHDQRLTQLIEAYKTKLNLHNSHTLEDGDAEMSSSKTTLSDYSKFTLIHSKDGSELYTSILQSCGLNASDLDNTINSGANGGDTTVSTIVAANGANKAQQQRTANNIYTTFICFLISDFDQDDNVFIKLEETQLKLSNFLSALNLATANSSHSGQNNSQKRFMIFGWPVLYYCLENSLVPKRISRKI